MSVRFIPVFLFFIVLLLCGCDGAKEAPKRESFPPVNLDKLPAENPYRGSADAEREGAAIFGKICSQCHGADGTGGPDAPDLTDRMTVYGEGDDARFRIVYKGTQKGMPTWGEELGGEKIWKVLAHIDSLKKKRDGR